MLIMVFSGVDNWRHWLNTLLLDIWCRWLGERDAAHYFIWHISFSSVFEYSLPFRIYIYIDFAFFSTLPYHFIFFFFIYFTKALFIDNFLPPPEPPRLSSFSFLFAILLIILLFFIIHYTTPNTLFFSLYFHDIHCCFLLYWYTISADIEAFIITSFRYIISPPFRRFHYFHMDIESCWDILFIIITPLPLPLRYIVFMLSLFWRAFLLYHYLPHLLSLSFTPLYATHYFR